MRFARLGLDRYGRFTDRTLDFDRDARVSVVLGSNEAGKTTALAAACDVLFGIDFTSRFNFLHDYAAMRLSATLVDGAGHTLSFARRKRNKATIVDPETDAPLPDDVLAPFLGAHDRAAFLDIFGLDQKRLRDGGKKLLAGGGDLAETLIAAAPGLNRVADLRDAMRASAAELFNPDRKNAKAPFYVAVERYRSAQAEIQARELRGEEVKALRAAEAEAAALRTSAGDAEIEAHLAEQRAAALIRAAKELRAVARAEAALAALGPLPAVDGAFPQLARTRLDAHARASEAEAAARAAAQMAQAAREAIAPDAAVLAVAEAIVRCDEDRAKIEHERASLPHRRQEAEEARAGLAHIAANLGLADVTTLRARLPGRPLLARAGDLLGQMRDLAGRRDALAQDEEGLIRARRVLDATASGLPPAEDPAPLRRAIDALDGAEARETARASLARQLAAAREAQAARLARLPYGPWQITPLARAPLPDAATAEQALRAITAAADTLARLKEQGAELEGQHEQWVARRAMLDAAGTAPTAQAIAAARDRRDGLWQNLRPALLGQRPPEADDAARAEDFEHAMTASDRLADDRLSASQRLADISHADIALAELAARRASHATRVMAAEADLDAARLRWQRLWSEAGLSPEPDPRALAFLQEVAALRADADERARQQADLSHQDAVCHQERAQVEQLHVQLQLPALGAGPIRLAVLRGAIGERDEAFARQRDLIRDRKRLDEQSAHLTRQRATLDAKARACAEEAESVFPVLAIRAAAPLQEVQAALELWQEAPALAEKLATAERRIAGIEQDEIHFTAQVEALLAQLDAPAGDDLCGTVRALRARLDGARQARAKADAADATLAERTIAATAAAATLARAETGLQEVLAQAGLDDAAALPMLIDRLTEAATLRADLAQARARLDSECGDRSLDEVRAAIAERDDDALVRDAATAAAAHSAARAARDEAVERHTQARAALAALEQRAGAAAAAQEAQDAVAELDGTMARFTRAHVAARLLTHAIERYRQTHENPIITRAAEAFRTLTRGQWDGIAVDYDAEPARLAAVREARLHGVDALSEGTGDQLFLALRVAAIEEHARRAAPLPFLADDLFVTFDEARTEAGLRLLGELGATTQVIVFTHHTHVAEAATRALGAAAQVITL